MNNDTAYLKDLFLLNPEIAFFNHGSFGACPRPVYETWQNWQREMEWQPVDFLGRNRVGMMETALTRVAQYLHVPVENVIFVTNATVGMNIVARSLPLQPGDEILTSNHEYGAVNRTWAYACQKTGAMMVEHHIDLPVTTHEAFVEAFWAQVTPRTRVISLSHITSPTALIFPIKEICRRARAAGILTVIDGAHAPGHIPLALEDIGADFYTGNFHKWLCAPKGSAFLYARPEHHDMLDPAVISAGWLPENNFNDRNEWQGTRDISPYLTVPAAIDFQAKHNWDQVRAACHELLMATNARITALTGLPTIATDPDLWFGQMMVMPMPKGRMPEIYERLYNDYNVVPTGSNIDGQDYMRISIQGYNTQQDCDRLVEALAEILKTLD